MTPVLGAAIRPPHRASENRYRSEGHAVGERRPSDRHCSPKASVSAAHANNESYCCLPGPTPKQDGSFTIYTGPGDVLCKVHSVAEVLEFANKLKHAVEVADLN